MTTLTPLEKAALAARGASDKKGEDIVLMDMRKLSSFCDWFVIVSANSSRRIETIIRAVRKALSERAVKPLHTESSDGPYWSLLDYGDIVVHVFQEHVRQFYGLERLWSEAPRTYVDEKWLQKTPPK